jgi:hypothetical protein
MTFIVLSHLTRFLIKIESMRIRWAIFSILYKKEHIIFLLDICTEAIQQNDHKQLSVTFVGCGKIPVVWRI